MRITLDGEVFDLSTGLLRASLIGHSPEDIRSYWVELDGVRWPVKQVISLATGASRGRFQSQDSRRWLKNLGLRIGAASSTADYNSVPQVVGVTRRRHFDEAQLEELDSMDFRVAFSWWRVGVVTLDEAGLPVFPGLPRVPGLYRYDFGWDDTGVRTLYIGESVDLARRASNYRNAKTDRSRQRTSRRIHKEITNHLTRGGSIEFAVSTSVQWNGGVGLDLRLASVRRLAENAAVVLAQSQPKTRVLNVDADLRGDTE